MPAGLPRAAPPPPPLKLTMPLIVVGGSSDFNPANVEVLPREEYDQEHLAGALGKSWSGRTPSGLAARILPVVGVAEVMTSNGRTI